MNELGKAIVGLEMFDEPYTLTIVDNYTVVETAYLKQYFNSQGQLVKEVKR